MKTNLTVFFSPKTAGASLVSLNAALLLSGSQKTAFVEVGGWSSQSQNFPALSRHHWGECFSFYDTKEWAPALLDRSKASLGADIFWSPLGAGYPEFQAKSAQAWLELLQSEYSHIVVDLNVAAPEAWRDFWLTQATHIVGVVTPDPISLEAWSLWQKSTLKGVQTRWLLNQVPSLQLKNLEAQFSAADSNFLGTLPLEAKKAWDQAYLAFPIVAHKRSKFKSSLTEILKPLIS